MYWYLRKNALNKLAKKSDKTLKQLQELILIVTINQQDFVYQLNATTISQKNLLVKLNFAKKGKFIWR